MKTKMQKKKLKLTNLQRFLLVLHHAELLLNELFHLADIHTLAFLLLRLQLLAGLLEHAECG